MQSEEKEGREDEHKRLSADGNTTNFLGGNTEECDKDCRSLVETGT